MTRTVQIPDHPLLDALIAENCLKNDAALSRMLEVKPPVLSKIRHGRLPFGPSLILRTHDVFDMPIKTIRALLQPAAA